MNNKNIILTVLLVVTINSSILRNKKEEEKKNLKDFEEENENSDIVQTQKIIIQFTENHKANPINNNEKKSDLKENQNILENTKNKINSLVDDILNLTDELAKPKNGKKIENNEDFKIKKETDTLKINKELISKNNINNKIDAKEIKDNFQISSEKDLNTNEIQNLEDEEDIKTFETKKKIKNSVKDETKIEIIKKKENKNVFKKLTFITKIYLLIVLITFFCFFGILISSLFYNRYIKIYNKEPFKPYNCIRFLYRNPKDKENQEIRIICTKYIKE